MRTISYMLLLYVMLPVIMVAVFLRCLVAVREAYRAAFPTVMIWLREEDAFVLYRDNDRIASVRPTNSCVVVRTVAPGGFSELRALFRSEKHPAMVEARKYLERAVGAMPTEGAPWTM